MRKLNKQQKLDAKASHHKLVKSGMFWELFPALSGEWNKDKTLWYNVYLEDLEKVYKNRDKEPRTLIPICKRHKRFQTKNGRWLDMKDDLENHIIYTGSQDAILSDGQCDMCHDKGQIALDFSGMRGNGSGEE